jgi:hypothetical protein
MIFKKIKLFLVASILLLSYVGFAQIERPVTWSYSAEQKGEEATIILKATIEKGWHLYSQDIPTGGPIPTSFKFNSSPDFSLVGKTIEPKAE